MREVTVIASSDTKFSNQKETDAEKNCGEIRLHKEGCNCEEMDSKE